MFLTLIAILFKDKNGMEAESVTFLFNVPEEAPTHFIYEAVAGDLVQKYVCEVTPNGLLTRLIESEEELDAIRSRAPVSEEVEEEV